MKSIETMVNGILFLGLAAIGYSGYIAYKTDKICSKINLSVDKLSDQVDVDIPDILIKNAVNLAVDRAVQVSVKNATTMAVEQVRGDISNKVRNSIERAYSDLKEDVQNEMHKQIGNIDVSSIRQEVVKKASERAAEKFDRDLENVLEKYNRDLNNVSRIYKYIAQSISSHEDNKGMTFRVA